MNLQAGLSGDLCPQQPPKLSSTMSSILPEEIAIDFCKMVGSNMFTKQIMSITLAMFFPNDMVLVMQTYSLASFTSNSNDLWTALRFKWKVRNFWLLSQFAAIMKVVSHSNHCVFFMFQSDECMYQYLLWNIELHFLNFLGNKRFYKPRPHCKEDFLAILSLCSASAYSHCWGEGVKSTFHLHYDTIALVTQFLHFGSDLSTKERLFFWSVRLWCYAKKENCCVF